MLMVMTMMLMKTLVKSKKAHGNEANNTIHVFIPDIYPYIKYNERMIYRNINENEI